MKLRVITTKEEDEPLDVEVEVDEGIEVLKFQISSLTGIDPGEQVLYLGESACPIHDNQDVKYLLSQAQSPRPGSSFLSVLRGEDVHGWRQSCSRVYTGSEAVIQPAFFIPGSEQRVCLACSQACFPEGLAAPDTSGQLRAFACEAATMCEQGLGEYLFVSRLGKDEAVDLKEKPLSVRAIAILSSLKAGAFEQQALGFSPSSGAAQDMNGRLQSGCQTVLVYEDPTLQSKALSVIPVGLLHDRAQAAGGVPSQHADFRDAVFRELLAWFKHEFFRWVNQPPCDQCGKGTSLVGGAAPTPEERAGKAGRVEVYKCNECAAITRFPRYNHPGKLLETRRGRCGEWANCFTLCCRAMGYEARYIMDWTDHVWTEFLSEASGRWTHADPCENRMDHPLMYEKGWNKQLTYVLGFAKDGVRDVTKRYTHQYDALLKRRDDVPEAFLAQQISSLDQHMRGRSGATGARLQELDRRARDEDLELQMNITLGETQQPLKPGEVQGRISGSEAWKRARGEDGGKGGSSSDSGATCDMTCTSDPQGPKGPAYLPRRMDVVGLRVPGAQEGRSLVVRVTSLGLQDPVPASFAYGSSSRYSSSVITVNGLACALGNRGHNVVVVDLNTKVIHDSVSFDTSGDPDAGARLQDYLENIKQGGSYLVCVAVIDTGDAYVESADKGLRACGAGDKAAKLGHREAYALVGCKEARPWIMEKTTAKGCGPARCLVEVPLLSSSAAAGGEDYIWEDRVGQAPLGQATEGIQQDNVQAASLKLMEDGKVPPKAVLGYSYKAGKGVFLLGPGSFPLLPAAGWYTKVLGYHSTVAEESGAEEGKEDNVSVNPQQRFQAAFEGLIKQGMEANEAAAKAILMIAQQPPPPPSPSTTTQVFQVDYSECVGSRHIDTIYWDDTDVAIPPDTVVLQSSYQTAKLVEVVVWAGDKAVNGLQALYKVGEERVMGPIHKGEHGAYQEHRFVLEATEHVTAIEVVIGAIVDSLVLITSSGRRVAFGNQTVVEGAKCHKLEVGAGQQLVGFVGGVGGHLHSLGLILTRGQRAAATLSTAPPPPPHLWGVYTASPVLRMARDLLMGPGGKMATLEALEAARRYIGNCQQDPSNPKFRRIRCRTKFFSDKIGCRFESGLLMKALGFDFVIAQDVDGVEEPCYDLPLTRATPQALGAVNREIDAAIHLIRALP